MAPPFPLDWGFTEAVGIAVLGVVALLLGGAIGATLATRAARARAAAHLQHQADDFALQCAKHEQTLAAIEARAGMNEDAAVKRDQFAHDLIEQRTASVGTISKLETQIVALTSDVSRLQAERDEARSNSESARVDAESLRNRLTASEARATSESEATRKTIQDLVNAREALGNQFKAIAGEILQQKSEALATQGITGIREIFTPVQQKLTEFQTKVEEFQKQNTVNATQLSTELGLLNKTSSTLGNEASKLTHALTSQAQVRGAWGEQVLGRLLELAGLQNGVSFIPQETYQTKDGGHVRPDVVVTLPGSRKIVVDSKCSLVDYQVYATSPDESERDGALKRHVAAVREHIKALSEKHYEDLFSGATLDFVIAFIPIEPAYLAALHADASLYDDTWKRHVLLACPSTLLYVLRVVSYLWTQEAQAKNVEAIAQRGAELYDKFVGFITDFEKIGNTLASAKGAYDEAYSKLAKGRGNVVRQTQMLRELGVKPKKSISTALLEVAAAEAETLEPSTSPMAPAGNGGDSVNETL